MVRLARVVAPGMPHHITPRGHRRQQAVFCAEDYQDYIALRGAWGRSCAGEGWAYCLMPNPVHWIAVPDSADGLRRAIGDAPRRDTRRGTFREGWRGHLWQGRFASCARDAPSLRAAARSREQNPVRAGLAASPWEDPGSSARAQVAGRADSLVKTAPLLAGC
jgi:putative transposase